MSFPHFYFIFSLFQAFYWILTGHDSAIGSAFCCENFVLPRWEPFDICLFLWDVIFLFCLLGFLFFLLLNELFEVLLTKNILLDETSLPFLKNTNTESLFYWSVYWPRSFLLMVDFTFVDFLFQHVAVVLQILDFIFCLVEWFQHINTVIVYHHCWNIFSLSLFMRLWSSEGGSFLLNCRWLLLFLVHCLCFSFLFPFWKRYFRPAVHLEFVLSLVVAFIQHVVGLNILVIITLRNIFIEDKRPRNVVFYRLQH